MTCTSKARILGGAILGVLMLHPTIVAAQSGAQAAGAAICLITQKQCLRGCGQYGTPTYFNCSNDCTTTAQDCMKNALIDKKDNDDDDDNDNRSTSTPAFTPQPVYQPAPVYTPPPPSYPPTTQRRR